MVSVAAEICSVQGCMDIHLHKIGRMMTVASLKCLNNFTSCY